MENLFTIGQTIDLPTNLLLTPIGVKEKKDAGILKTRDYVVSEISEDGKSVTFITGKNKLHEKNIDTVLKIQQIIKN